MTCQRTWNRLCLRLVCEAARAGQDIDPAHAQLVRVVEYEVADGEGSGSGELIVLLTTITSADDARAEELASAYYQRWEEETANDQLKTHLRGPGRVLRSRLPDLVHQEIWACLIVRYPISILIARAADLDPGRINCTRTLRIIRRTATGTPGFTSGVPAESGVVQPPAFGGHLAGFAAGCIDCCQSLRSIPQGVLYRLGTCR
jgi:hypothetical protein